MRGLEGKLRIRVRVGLAKERIVKIRGVFPKYGW